MKALILLSCCLLPECANAAPSQAQAEKPAVPQTNIRVASGAVVLDVVVTDKKNRVVTDLKQDDFVVYEDDAVQKVDSFQARTAVPAGSGRAGAPNMPTSAASQPSYLIFLLDFSTTQVENQKLVREAAAKFVEKSLAPTDYLAVFYNGVGFKLLKEFTNDKAQLAAVLNQQDVGGVSRSATSGAQAAARADAGSATPIGQVNAALGAMAAASAAAGDATTARVVGGVGSMDSAVNQRTTYGILAAIENISQVVEPLEGRKTLVMFSQGFVVDGKRQEDELQHVIGVANKANVAVYAVDASGLSTGVSTVSELGGIGAESGGARINAQGGRSVFDRARTAGSDTRDSALRYMAAATGGEAFRNTNDLSVSLGRVAQDMRSHYLLSYQPTNQVFDGRFRKVRVELKQPGLAVRTRSGYIARPASPEALTAEETQLMAAARDGSTTALPFDVALAQFPAGPQRSRVPVTIEVPARDLKFSTSGDKLVASLLIVGLLRDREGKVITRVGTPVNVAATPEEYKVLEKGSVSFTNTIELSAGQYSLETFVRDQGSGKGAVRDYSLQIVPLGDKLSASSIVLSSQVDPMRAGESESDLTLGKTRVLPSARRQFRNGENLVYLFNVYNVAASEQKKPNLEVRISIERPGSAGMKLPAFKVEQLDTDGIPHVSVGRYVALNGLVAGRYFFVAEVEDLDSKQVCKSRTSFEIVP